VVEIKIIKILNYKILPLLSTGDWGDIAALRGAGCVIFPFYIDV
jgi:hypothetical protein